MISICRCLIVAIFLLSHSSCVKANIVDNEIVINRLSLSINEHPDSGAVQKAISLINPDGSYEDIDYTITSYMGQYGWIPKYHLYRLVTLASAYADKSSSRYNDSGIYGLIQKGLDYWIKVDPKCTNWWWGTIGVPCNLGSILILVESAGGKIGEELKTSILEIMKDAATSPNDFSDANRFDVALHWIYRACLTDDEDVLRVALESIYGLLDISETGFQVDGSFFHDGNQFFIGSY